jgi:hypothetical protein
MEGIGKILFVKLNVKIWHTDFYLRESVIKNLTAEAILFMSSATLQ